MKSKKIFAVILALLILTSCEGAKKEEIAEEKTSETASYEEEARREIIEENNENEADREIIEENNENEADREIIEENNENEKESENSKEEQLKETKPLKEEKSSIPLNEEDKAEILPYQSEVSISLDKIISLINEERAKEGLQGLVKDEILMEASALRAQELTKVFDHTRPDNTPWYTILEEMGVSLSHGCGENAAMGQISEEEVVTDWMESQSHKDIILLPNGAFAGIGIAQDAEGIYYFDLIIRCQ